MKNLSMTYNLDRRGFNLGHCRALLRCAPNLENLTVWGCNGVAPGLALARMRRLEFGNSYLDVGSLRNLVSACPLLEDFSYECKEHDFRELWGDEFLGFSLREAWRELRPVRQTLQRLSLVFESTCHPDWDEAKHSGEAGSGDVEHLSSDPEYNEKSGFPKLTSYFVDCIEPELLEVM